MKLRIIKGEEPGREYVVNGKIFTIGRESDNDLVINETSVSRRHCQLHREDDIWMVEDLHSMNGVYINEVKIDGGSQLYDQDVIKVFNHELLFIDEDSPSAKDGRRQRDAASCSFKDPMSTIKTAVKIGVLVCIAALCGFFAIRIFTGKNKPPVEINEASGGSVESGKASGSGKTAANGTSMLSEEDLKNLTAEPVPVQPVEAAVATANEAAVPSDNGMAAAQPANVALVLSEPPGAEVYLDNEPKGTTPVLLQGLGAGRHTLELEKEGYEKSIRQFHVPDQMSSKPIELVLKPGVVSITSEPSGAWVWEGIKFCGVTPLLLTGLSDGEHKFHISGPACEQHVEAVTVSEAKGEKVHVSLKVLLGALEIVTKPAGCTVFLNGVAMGTTKAGESSMRSAPMNIGSLIPGPCVIKVEHPSGISRSGNLTIPRGQAFKTNVALWIPTHRLTLADGTEAIGMLVEENDMGDITLEFANGKYERYLKPQIADKHEIAKDEVDGILEKLGKDKGSLSSGNAFGRKDDFTMSAIELKQQMDKMSEQGFNAAYANKQIKISGLSSTRMKEKGLIVVLFDFSLKCVFAPGTPGTDYEAISAAAEMRKPIVLRGICEGSKNKVVTIKNCTLVDD